jgi:hypothetical protein
MKHAPLAAVSLLFLLTCACQPNAGEPGPSAGSSGASGGQGGGRAGAAAGGTGGGGGSGGASAPDVRPVDPISPDAGTDSSVTPADGGTDGAPASDCTTAQPNSLFCKPLGKMPTSIRETGLFPAAPDLTKHPASMREYVPSPELWSDGMSKQRFLLLPAGKKIDNTDRAKWEFPIGTVFIKTFFDDTGAGGKPRPIETRFIRRVGDANAFTEYDYYLYEWNAQGTDATLVVDDENGDINQDKPVMVTISRMKDGQPFAVNGGRPFPHVLPSRKACGDCHGENGKLAQTFIGFDELRLNSKFTTTSAKTQLQALGDADIFTMEPPAQAATLADSTNPADPLPRIKRFVFGNCVHCHTGMSQVDLRPEVFEQNTVGKQVEAQSVVPPRGWLRVFPGDPTRSVLFVQMRRTMLPEPTGGGTMNRLRPMPPIGVADQAADQAALGDVEAWIRSLPSAPAP